MRRVAIEIGLYLSAVALIALAVAFHRLHTPRGFCREHVIFYSEIQDRVVRAARFENGWFEALADRSGRFEWDTDKNQPEKTVRLNNRLLNEMRYYKAMGAGPAQGFIDEIWPPWDDPERLIGEGEVIFKRR